MIFFLLSVKIQPTKQVIKCLPLEPKGGAIFAFGRGGGETHRTTGQKAWYSVYSVEQANSIRFDLLRRCSDMNNISLFLLNVLCQVSFMQF